MCIRDSGLPFQLHALAAGRIEVGVGAPAAAQGRIVEDLVLQAVAEQIRPQWVFDQIRQSSFESFVSLQEPLDARQEAQIAAAQDALG